MELRVRRDTFLAELNPMQGIVERRTTIPVLSHLLLSAAGDRLRLAATDLDVSLTSSVPAEVSRIISERLRVPTISYGAGVHCDGQGMVSADMFGLFEDFKPKFSKRYVDLGSQVLKTFEAYRDDVLAKRFPAEEHTYHIDPKELAAMVRDGSYVDLPPGFVVDARWDNQAKVARMPAPYLAMHGLSDDYVRWQYAQDLTAAHAAKQTSATKLVLVPGSDHGDNSPAVALGADYVPLLREFLGL